MFYQLHPMASAETIIKEQNENFSYPTHLHQSFELIITISGEMAVEVDGISYSAKEKEAVIIFPNKRHSLASTKSKHILFIFSPKIVGSFSKKHADEVPVSCKFALNDFLFNALLSLSADDSVTSIKGVLYSVLAEVERQIEFVTGYSDKDDLLMKIFTFVENSYRCECSLFDAARAIGYDHAYISRYFKRSTGISYNSYVNICRLNHAAYLLSNTNLSILECSIESGFKSLRSFNRNFKDYFKKTPATYSKKTKK